MSAAEFEGRLLEVLELAQLTSASGSTAQTVHADEIGLDQLSGVGLDTNVLKHFRREPLLATTLSETLSALGVALIMPGQTVIEFWNNHRTFAKDDWSQIDSDVKKLRKRLSDMGALSSAEGRLAGIESVLDEIVSDLQESTAPDFLQRSQQVMDTLLEYAVQPMVSRSRFHNLGLGRLRSKVPPGFADAALKGELSLGDFYGWCDFMLGALSLPNDSGEPLRFLFFTDENKADWRTGKLAHPQLVNEFRHVTGGEVGVAYMTDLRKLLRDASQGTSSPGK